MLAGHKRLLLLRAYTFQNWNACFYCVSGFAIFWSVLYFYVHKVVFLLSAHFGCQIKKLELTAVKTLKNRKNGGSVGVGHRWLANALYNCIRIAMFPV